MSHAWPRWPPADEHTRQALAVAVLAGRWAVSGPPSTLPSFLEAAAARVAEMAGRRFAMLTSSGSSAIVLALQALGIGPGHRVLMPATTWVGCATAVLRTGATPVFVDAAEFSPCAPSQLDGKSLGPVDAVLAIHLYASQVDVLALRASLPGVPVVEDCSHCHGATAANGRPLGTLGDLSIFSFQATKVLPAGEGGAVVTDDEDMAGRLFALATDSRRLVHPTPLDALNRLEPAGLLHGANQAMSEFSGAVLWAQLLRLPELAARRAEGLERVAAGLDPESGRLVFDQASAASGGFYGVPFLPARPWRDGVTRVVEEVRDACGAHLDRVYPPIPSSPLYRPWTIPTYRRTGVDPRRSGAHLPNSSYWHREGIVLPHALFLADQPRLAALASAIGGLAGSRRRARIAPAPQPPGADCSEACVVVLTTGTRDTLTAALRSVAEQTHLGPRSVLLLCDDRDGAARRVPGLVAAADLPAEIPVRRVTLALDLDTGPGNVFARVALLRNTALCYVTAPLVAFLDDDNSWEPDHLASLASLKTKTGALAVHCWRRLLTPEGEPHVPDTFPWLASPAAAAARFALLTEAGVFERDSDVVRGGADVRVAGGDHGMVDMGEWLFDRRVFDLVRFETEWTPEELAGGVGEDDKLLKRLRELLIPIHCSERATLRYRLGGFTNAFGASANHGRSPART